MATIIDFQENKCRHCHRCVRSCEVKSVAFRNGKAFVMPNRCILCGECLVNCPQSAKRVVSDLDRVKAMIREGRRVVLSLSPAYLGVFGYNKHRKFITAMKRLGFSEVRSTAEGTALIAEEYVGLLNRGLMDSIITTTCPGLISLIEIYYPELIRYLAPVRMPSAAHISLLRAEYGEDAALIYLGPCVAEKDGRRSPRPDAILTFEEVREWLTEENIDIASEEPDESDLRFLGANLRYVLGGGFIAAVDATEKVRGLSDHYRRLYASGVKDCMEMCEAIMSGQIRGCLIEMNICHGGCINGPMASRKVSGFHLKLVLEEKLEDHACDRGWIEREKPKVRLTQAFTDRSVAEKIPTDLEVTEILRKTGKSRPDQELNCGACGYATCRDKATAVFQGKAELDMCIPYLHKKASSLAHMVMETAPNAILVLDDALKILECSSAVSRFFGIRPEVMRGNYLMDYMDTANVEEVFKTHENVQRMRVSYPERGLITLENIAYVPESDYVILTIIDITEDEKKSEEDLENRKATVQLAQDVIRRQMLVAQQIAGLLGETTAETQTTLTRLCSLVDNPAEDAGRK